MSYDLTSHLKGVLLRAVPGFLPDRWKAPRVLTFLLTYRCNLRCAVCWQWGEQGLFRGMREEDEARQLDLNTLCSVIDDVAEDAPGVFLWGGEPFLHPDLIPFVEHVKSRGLHCSINTNGIRLTREAGRLAELGVDEIMVSVDGPRDVHDRIRGREGSFGEIAAGVRALREARDGNGSRPEIVVNTTISSGNQALLLETAGAVEELGADRMILSQLWFTTEAIGKAGEEYFREKFGARARSWRAFLTDVSTLDTALIEEQMRKLSMRKGGMKIRFLPDLHPGQVRDYYSRPGESFGRTRCLVPWLESQILPDGSVTPCSDRPDLIMGNVKQERFREIWNNDRYRSFRRAMREEGLFPCCSRCCGLWSH